MARTFTFEEAAARLREAAAALPRFGEDMAVKLSNNAIADIEGRIREKGINADGGPMSPDYTPQYKSYKKRKGRYKGHVDLDLTGRMWGNTGVVENRKSPKGGFFVTIAGRNQETQDKLDWNSERYGDVLRLSAKEQEELTLDFEEGLANFLRTFDI